MSLAASALFFALFTRVRGIGILRTSPFGDSAKFGLLYAACSFSGRTTNTGQWA
jgi:hypothetical protein